MAIRRAARGLALFYLETRDAQGRLDRILVNRLKDKLGTRKVPTAELTLDGTPAQLVSGTEGRGQEHHAACSTSRARGTACAACAYMRRAHRARARLRAQARRLRRAARGEAAAPRHAGRPGGGVRGAFHLAFFVVELIGRDEAGEGERGADDLLRLLTPVAKLTAPRSRSVAIVQRGDRMLRRARATSRTPACRCCCATRRCCRSGKARPTCCRWMRCASRRGGCAGGFARADLRVAL